MPPKHSGTFRYPGGKTTIAPWIIDHFPDHEVYVEPFGGSASVLMRKPRSPVEVYNDTNSDCVTFFEAIKNYPEELRKWVDSTPHSRELFEQWLQEWHSGDRPDDIVEHAGRFWYLTTVSFGGKIYDGDGTFSVNKTPLNDAQYSPTQWQRKTTEVQYLKSRFDTVQIEHEDFTAVIERYDSP
ncbi:MAG: DNA adenine methylase, partial [Halobacteriaceae archaeon]